MSQLELRGIRIQLRSQSSPLIELPELTIQQGEIVVLMGPSGSGKSSLLHWLVGDSLPEFDCSGEIRVGGVRVDALPTQARRIGLRMQQPWLFPHLTVRENLQCAQRGTETPAERARQLQACLDAFGIAHLSEQAPDVLSGGQAARVALARAILNQPAVMLLDEPFSSLDTATREEVRAWTFAQLARQGLPTLLVTHDIQDIPEHAQVIYV